MNVVQICNLALSRLGAHRIQSLTEQTKEAIECKLLYDISRRTTLEAHDWSFARKAQVLALSTEAYTGWDYAYVWPTDCIAPRSINDETGAYTGTSYDIDEDRYKQTGRVQFVHISNSTLSGRLLLTNKEDAELVYTADAEDANVFSPLFVETLAYKLASDLAMPLRGKIDLQATLLSQFDVLLGRSSTSNSNQEEKKPDNVNTLVSSRG